jgi:hypothetical protein
MSVIINPTTQQATIALNANNLGVVGLMAFVSYSGSTLVLMHKGYLDFDNISTDSNPNALQSWQIGQTIYLNNNKISITPPNTSGSWVKSIGFCMPNNINKKRIWFESDSTFLTLQ